MKTNFKGLRTTIYKVSDIIKAKDWYTNVLSRKPYFDEAFYVGFNVGGYELGLQPDETSATSKSSSVVTYWGVDDVKKSYQQLLDAGATTFEEPANVGGDIVVAAVKDPWGNVFGIIFNPNFELPK